MFIFGTKHLYSYFAIIHILNMLPVYRNKNMNALGDFSQSQMLASKNGEISRDIFGIIDHSQMEITYKNTLLFFSFFFFCCLCYQLYQKKKNYVNKINVRIAYVSIIVIFIEELQSARFYPTHFMVINFIIFTTLVSYLNSLNESYWWHFILLTVHSKSPYFFSSKISSCFASLSVIIIKV